ncbi:PPP4R2-domain-containing protein [Pisolithus croceorrhizus]|nr:PPP4R2-domain-containing protein [Pisolithus croceorrhizus]
MYHLSPTFQWDPAYEAVLERIAATDIIGSETEWSQLREMIKFKLEQNVAIFLSDAEQRTEVSNGSPTTLPTGVPDSSGNLRLPPFPPHRPNELNSYRSSEEANELKTLIFKQLHDFDESPPFTIQRVCELCVHPKKHYKAIGKYLRAVERSLLVTSTWSSFPPETSQNGLSLGSASVNFTTQSTPSTPMFSPIPFLHGDARRSKSHSPPPSPLTLAAMEAASNIEPLGEALPQRAIGLVDELDDPRPGHMSEHPTAITAVTTAHPFIETLESRFVRGGEQVGQGETGMSVDSTGGKETEDKSHGM